MEAQLSRLVGEGRSEFMRPLEPPPIANPDDLLPGVAAARHHLVKLRAQRLRIEVRDHVREDFGGAVLERAKHTEQHAARDTAPGARAPPRLPFATLLACELALAAGTRGQTCALGGAPPARPGEGKAPEARVIFIAQQALTAARLVLERRQVERAVSEISRGGSAPPRGAVAAQRVFFKTPRPLARPSGMPVARATTVASARPLQGAWMAPGSRGA
jgi:hypothetical protein